MRNGGISGRGKLPGPGTGIEIRKSICTICDPEAQCGLDLYVKDGRIIKVEGSKENPHNQGTLCAKGSALRQYIYHEDRIKTPLKRIGPRNSGTLAPISWDEALNTIAEKLQMCKARYGPESVVFSSGYSFWYRDFLYRMANVFGSPNIVTEAGVCHFSMVISQLLTCGIPAGPDVKNAKCLLVWSTNPFHSRTGRVRHLLDAKERGLKIITVDVRRSPMAAHADIHLQPKPGTDGALALAMAHVIVAEKLYDCEFVETYTHGFEEYRDYLKEFSPAQGEAITGVPVEKIVAAARLYATSKPAALMPGSSPVIHHTNGLQSYRAIFSLMGLTGNYDVVGGNFAEPLSYLYEPGGFMTREQEFRHAKQLPELAPRIGEDTYPVWMQFFDEAHGVHLPHQMHSGTPYPIKALMAFGINYRMWPDPDFFAASLEKLDFIAISDVFLTESCTRFADIVLPACTSVERSELRCYPERYVIFTQPAIAPLHKSWPDVEVVLALAKRLGLDDPLLAAGFEAGLDWILEPSGITVEALKDHPGGMPVPDPITFPEKKYLPNGFMTPSGKFEFKSLLLEKYGYDALPIYRPPKYSHEATPEIAVEYPFILNTGSRLPMLLGSQTFRVPWLRSLRPEAAADLNPDDGNRLGIAQGDLVKISTPKGSVVVKANLTEMVQPGVVHLSPAFIEVKVNSLIEADYVDPIAGTPGYKSLLCKVETLQCGGKSRQ
jgi:anaerobic selenocysteine-containing dehydrogenase